MITLNPFIRGFAMSLQQEIIQALGVKPTINPEEEVRRSVDFLKNILLISLAYVLWCSGLAEDKTQHWLESCAK